MMCRFKNKGLVRRNLRDLLKIPVEPVSRCGAGRIVGVSNRELHRPEQRLQFAALRTCLDGFSWRPARLAGEQRIQAVEFVQVLWPPRATQFFE